MKQSEDNIISDIQMFAQNISDVVLADYIADPELRSDIARKIASDLTFQIEEEYAGQQVYVRTRSIRRKERIFSEFTGKNYKELAKKYHLTERSVRIIIENERKKRRTHPQQCSLI